MGKDNANEGRSKTFVLIMPSAANLRCVAAKKRKARAETNENEVFKFGYAEPPPIFAAPEAK